MTDFNNLVIQNFKDLNKRLDKQEEKFENIEKALLSVTNYVDKKLEKKNKKSILNNIPKSIWYIIGGLLMGIGAKYGIDFSGITP